MYCPYKKYNLPSKDELENVRQIIKQKYPYIFAYPHTGIINKIFKSIGTHTVNSFFAIDNLAHKLISSKEKEFEIRCDNIFNVSKYAINQSLKTKNDTTIHLNSHMGLKLNEIKLCSKYNDFVQSLASLDTKVSIITHKTNVKSSDIILYNLKSNNLSILDEYKP